MGLFVGATFLSLGEIIDLFLGIVRILVITRDVTIIRKKTQYVLNVQVKKEGKKLKRERVFKIRQKSNDSVVRI